jgi:biopolymer transport protein ExbD
MLYGALKYADEAAPSEEEQGELCGVPMVDTALVLRMIFLSVQ